MESYIENVRKLSENPKELAIVKHYAMKFMHKKKWSNMVRNRKNWEKGGVSDSLFNAIIAQHYHFLWDEQADEYIGDPNATINRRRHIRAVRDYWEEEIEERDKEIEELRDDGNMITKKEHKEKIKAMEKEHERECEAMEDTIRSLKQKVSWQEDKRKAEENRFEKQLAFQNQTQQAMEKAHESALKAAHS